MPLRAPIDGLPTFDRGLEPLERLVGDVTGLTVIDVGAGDGGLVRALARRGAAAIGVECGTLPLAAARAADPEHPDRYRTGVAQALPIDTASADVVIFSNSLHHVPMDGMDQGLDEAVRVLKRGGRLYVTEPVADGELWAIIRLLDDETEVREAAYTALGRAAARHNLRQLDELHFRTTVTYKDFHAFVQSMVQVDESRRQLIDEQRPKLEALFGTNGTPQDDGIRFTGLGRSNLYLKP